MDVVGDRFTTKKGKRYFFQFEKPESKTSFCGANIVLIPSCRLPSLLLALEKFVVLATQRYLANLTFPQSRRFSYREARNYVGSSSTQYTTKASCRTTHGFFLRSPRLDFRFHNCEITHKSTLHQDEIHSGCFRSFFGFGHRIRSFGIRKQECGEEFIRTSNGVSFREHIDLGRFQLEFVENHIIADRLQSTETTMKK